MEPNPLWSHKCNGWLHQFRWICDRESISGTHFGQIFSKWWLYRCFGILSTPSYKQSGGDTIIESGGTISATTFKATGGTVTVNGTLDPTAVEIGSGATFQGMGKIVGNVSMGGTMILGGLGAPGTVTIFGNYEQTGNGIVRELISSSSNGLLNVSGDVALNSDSVLSISLLGGFNLLGDSFTIIGLRFARRPIFKRFELLG